RGKNARPRARRQSGAEIDVARGAAGSDEGSGQAELPGKQLVHLVAPERLERPLAAAGLLARAFRQIEAAMIGGEHRDEIHAAPVQRLEEIAQRTIER